MKYNIIFRMMACAAAGALMISCVGDANPVFEKNASVRMQEALSHAQEVLMAAPHGWVMDDFMDESNTTAIKGGYTMLLKFTSDKVTAWGEMCSNPSDNYTSLYKMTTDNGPVLSFDDNNYVLHYYSTPSGTGYNIYRQTDHYQALGGDFEFLILEAKADCVKLKGKRGGQTVNLYPLDREPAEYMAALVKTRDEMLVTRYEDAANGLSLIMDRDNRHLMFNKFDPSADVPSDTDVLLAEVPFLFTDSGIRLKRSPKSAFSKVEIEGAEALINLLKGIEERDINWDSDARSVSLSNLSVKGILPEGWLPYGEYIGEYLLTYNTNTTLNVKLEADEYLRTYTLSGLNPNYTLTVEYNLATGGLQLLGQIIGESGEYTYWFSPWAVAAGGSLWYTTSYGMKTQLDMASYEADKDHFTLNWVPGPSAAGKPVDSFILYQRHSSGSGNSGLADTSWHFPTTNFRLAYLKSFTKK